MDEKIYKKIKEIERHLDNIKSSAGWCALWLFFIMLSQCLQI